MSYVIEHDGAQYAEIGGRWVNAATFMAATTSVSAKLDGRLRRYLNSAAGALDAGEYERAEKVAIANLRRPGASRDHMNSIRCLALCGQRRLADALNCTRLLPAPVRPAMRLAILEVAISQMDAAMARLILTSLQDVLQGADLQRALQEIKSLERSSKARTYVGVTPVAARARLGAPRRGWYGWATKRHYLKQYWKQGVRCSDVQPAGPLRLKDSAHEREVDEGPWSA